MSIPAPRPRPSIVILAGRQPGEDDDRARNRGEGRRALWWLTAFVVGLALTLWLGWPPKAGAAAPGDCPTAPGSSPEPAPDPIRGQACPLPTAGAEGAKDQSRAEPVAIRIIDGDTFALGTEIVRIADIDTPELDGQCDAEKSLARQAAARLAALLAGHPWAIRRERTRKGEIRRDRYGRTLATLFTVVRDPADLPADPDGTLVSIGQVLVAEGLAVPWAGRRHAWCGGPAR